MSVDRSRKSGLSSWCKACRAITSKNWKSKYPDKYSKQKENKQAPDYLTQRAYMLKHRYGLSLEQYEELLVKQNNCCAICEKSSEALTYHLHVDHCHDNGHVRGLLCSACNLYVGYVKNNPKAFANGEKYLKESIKNGIG